MKKTGTDKVMPAPSASEGIEKTTDPTTPLYPLRVAAELTGSSVYALRQYVDLGLILPYKTESNRRLYSQTDLARIQCIRKHLTEDGLNIAGIKAMMGLTPCWLIKPCTLTDYKTCDAYTSTQEPCWQVGQKGAICEGVECRLCPVYQLGNQCSDIKALYKTYLPHSDSEELEQ